MNHSISGTQGRYVLAYPVVMAPELVLVCLLRFMMYEDKNGSESGPRFCVPPTRHLVMRIREERDDIRLTLRKVPHVY